MFVYYSLSITLTNQHVGSVPHNKNKNGCKQDIIFSQSISLTQYVVLSAYNNHLWEVVVIGDL